MTREEKILLLKGIANGKKGIFDLLGKCEVLIEVEGGFKDTQTGIVYKSIDDIPEFAKRFERAIIPLGWRETKDLKEAKAVINVANYCKPLMDYSAGLVSLEEITYDYRRDEESFKLENE